MKNILLIFMLALLMVGCKEEYAFDAEFTTPTVLNSPASVVIDVASPTNVILSWEGGAAAQGYVTYEILFDKAGGDFSAPIYRSFSDLGVSPTFTLTHSTLNTIARKAGIGTASTGNVIWTVTASKGGEVKNSDLTKEISVTRGAGIDYTGTTLYLYGTATENNGAGGQVMRRAADGVFIAYTKAAVNGNYYFKSSTTDSEPFICYADETGKIIEGSGSYNVNANAEGEVYRVTVDLNTQKMTGVKESILKGNVSLLEAEEEFEKELISDALKRANHVQSHAAELLGISRRILKYKMDKLKIEQVEQ